MLEFRTSAELAYRFDNNNRIGVAITHLSNANIYNQNPGTETITLNYSVPMDFSGDEILYLYKKPHKQNLYKPTGVGSWVMCVPPAVTSAWNA